MPKILIVEDDPSNLTMLRMFLERQKYQVLSATDGFEALEKIAQVDLILLDVMLPKLDGWRVAEIVRQDYPELPILMLSGRDSVDDQIQGLEFGADDYITKPYDLREVQARIKALLRRSGFNKTLSFEGLNIDIQKRQVFIDDNVVELSKLEFDILLSLAQQPNRIFSREYLLERFWGSLHDGVDRVVDVRIAGLRKKLMDDPKKPRFIETVRGIGYRFIGKRS